MEESSLYGRIKDLSQDLWKILHLGKAQYSYKHHI